MGILKEPCDKEFRGAIDKKVVVREYSNGQTILSTYPDMSDVKPSAAQLTQRKRFKKAQRHAMILLEDPATRALYKEKCKPGQRPHNILISELLKDPTLFNDDEERE